MYVCICKAVTDRRVDEVIDEGARSVEEIGERCGAGTDCGGCQATLRARVCHHGVTGRSDLSTEPRAER